jgi:uncharacterized repeat protein (TIGR03803 family)
LRRRLDDARDGAHTCRRTATRVAIQYAATGGKPVGPLMQATDGDVYGTSDQGGATGQGVVVRFAPATLTAAAPAGGAAVAMTSSAGVP